LPNIRRMASLYWWADEGRIGRINKTDAYINKYFRHFYRRYQSKNQLYNFQYER
jgi:hypothetical protein